MTDERSEACGRCAMSSVVGAATDDPHDEERAARDPFGEQRIEVEEDQLRMISPSAWLGRVTQRLDEFATRVVYGR